ncbi:MAG: hypothetical protein U1E23_09610 [Reyranellaceae bacterium]
MTPDERDRLAKLEQKVEGLDAWMRSIDGKLDDVRQAAHMGRGALALALRIGAVIVAVCAAGAWVFDRIVVKH